MTGRVIITDGFHDTRPAFTIDVINLPPYFNKKPQDQFINVGETSTYLLPPFTDPEHHSMTLRASYHNGPLPDFMYFDDQ